MDLLNSLSVTLLFVAVLALFQIPITIAVGLRRLQTNISFWDDGDEALQRRMRAHGNFIETVPIILIAMAAAEISGAPALLLWVGGLSLLIGRIVHYWTLIKVGWGNGRAIGMLLTFLPLALFPGYVLLHLANLV
ncbi:MAG: MAPEG family protein [Roseibium sp.]